MSFGGLTLGDVPSTVHKGFSHTIAEELFGRTGERGSGLWIERRVVLQSSPFSQCTHYFGGNVDCWPPVKICMTTQTHPSHVRSTGGHCHIEVSLGFHVDQKWHGDTCTDLCKNAS